jgi:hypothetical protein
MKIVGIGIIQGSSGYGRDTEERTEVCTGDRDVGRREKLRAENAGGCRIFLCG